MSATTTTWKKGDILYSSWGYDQTNIDFYEVLEVKPSGKTIVIAKIACESTPEKGFMTAEKMPRPGVVTGKPMLKRPRASSYSGYTVGLTSYSSAYPWDGKPKSYSWYA